MSERKLIISRHAVAAYSRRRNDPRSLKLLADAEWRLSSLRRKGHSKKELERLVNFYNELVEEIRSCVSYALANGLAMNHKPEGFVLYRRKNTNLPAGQCFVRCDEDANVGFIVKSDDLANEDVVVTTLTKAGVRR